MICSFCHTATVEWKGPMSALTHTECSNCGSTNCQVQDPTEDEQPCPHCGTAVRWKEPECCTCHINPPCSACVNAPLECPNCGEEFHND